MMDEAQKEVAEKVCQAMLTDHRIRDWEMLLTPYSKLVGYDKFDPTKFYWDKVEYFALFMPVEQASTLVKERTIKIIQSRVDFIRRQFNTVAAEITLALGALREKQAAQFAPTDTLDEMLLRKGKQRRGPFAR